MKKIIGMLLVLAMLCAGCTAEEPLAVLSNSQRLVDTARGAGQHLREMTIPGRVTEDPIAGFMGTELGVDAEVILPDADAIPLASTRKREFTQAEADALLAILCKDKTLTDEETGEKANLLLENGDIRGILMPGSQRYHDRTKHLEISKDHVLYYREPCDGYHALELYDDVRLDEMIDNDFSKEQTDAVAEEFAKDTVLREKMRVKRHNVLMRTRVNLREQKISMVPAVLYEYDPLVAGVPIVASPDLEYTGPQSLTSHEGRNTLVADRNQVQFVHLAAPFADTEILENDCALLPIEEVCAIFRTAIPGVSQKWEEVYNQIVLKSAVLSRIRLCERFIPEEGTNRGMLVPVWDFQVTFTAPLSQPWVRTVMTINAIDGSIIEN